MALQEAANEAQCPLLQQRAQCKATANGILAYYFKNDLPYWNTGACLRLLQLPFLYCESPLCICHWAISVISCHSRTAEEGKIKWATPILRSSNRLSASSEPLPTAEDGTKMSEGQDAKGMRQGVADEEERGASFFGHHDDDGRTRTHGFHWTLPGKRRNRHQHECAARWPAHCAGGNEKGRNRDQTCPARAWPQVQLARAQVDAIQPRIELPQPAQSGFSDSLSWFLGPGRDMLSLAPPYNPPEAPL